MKNLKYLFMLSTLLFFVAASSYADGGGCKNLEGFVQIYPITDGSCPVLKKKNKFFPGESFLHELGVPGTCFQGWIEGTLGNRSISGNVVSGLRASNLDPASIQEAASRFKLFDAKTGKKLGKVYTLDAIFDPQGDTNESLMIVGGTKRFKHRTGDFEVFGNALTGVPFRGEICSDDD